MKYRFLLLAGLLQFLGCGATSTTGNSPRAYSATAPVGDFLSITLDPAAQTLAYTNVSNGDSGTIPYVVNSDGTYALQDPQGYWWPYHQVPNFGMIVQAAKRGAVATAGVLTAVAKRKHFSNDVGEPEIQLRLRGRRPVEWKSDRRHGCAGNVTHQPLLAVAIQWAVGVWRRQFQRN
jgi:hypothetical protein